MKISKKLLFPNDIEELQFCRSTSIVRILFGLILLHRFIDLYFSSPIPFDNSFLSLLGIISAFFTLIGFLTPFFLPLLSLMNWLVSNNLASQIVSIITIILFLSHSWKFNSFDNFLRKKFFLISYCFKKIEILYMRTYILRTFAIWLWGGVCFSAMAFHFMDKSWITGTAVLTLLRTPYLNDFYYFFNNINDILLLNLSKFSLYGMAVWELFFWAIPGIKLIRNITFWWGILFFISSILFINLSYLPYLEILLWVAIYKPNIFTLGKVETYKESINKFHNKEKKDSKNNISEFPIIILGLISIIYMNFSTLLNIYGLTAKMRIFGGKMTSHIIPRSIADLVFGQAPVNVFNQDDLKMNRYSILICRNYKNGTKELVPFQDLNGGRLSYLANDDFYFMKSLAFQRWSRNMEAEEIYGEWLKLSKDVVVYDFFLKSRSKLSNYKILLLEHKPNYIKQNVLAGWNKSSKANIVFSKTIKTSEINSKKEFR